jgi:hypothetical protein
MPEPLSTRRIQDSDNCAFLDSGRPEIDSWLIDHAKRQHAEKRVTTFVWAEGDFVYGYFSLTPHRLVDADVSVSGHAGGPLTGYLIAKIGIRQSAANEVDRIELTHTGDVVHVSKLGQLIVDALVAAGDASQLGGGRYAFIDTTNEPPAILEALENVGFRSITAAASPTHYITLR